ncbi:hypothetical protein BDR04DRAFT_1165006 [Suillus decipiens]|nr:hypothetical protein BDR04DRAFT_1165006 [Suillus decipiens]
MCTSPQDTYESPKLPGSAASTFPSVPTSVIDVRVQATLAAPVASSHLSSYLEPPSIFQGGGTSNAQNLSSFMGCHPFRSESRILTCSCLLSDVSTISHPEELGRSSSPTYTEFPDIAAFRPDR